ncbi:MAG TPA: TIGR03435 family protein [Bryobacteraceae bacterium]|nr:TIGR03435 family protein [Bryobacteraceae bacterium]
MGWYRWGFSLLLCAVAAAQTPSFEVASVKPSGPDEQPSANFPLGPGDAYVANGGLFNAKAFPLAAYIFFAYKIPGSQGAAFRKQLPRWAMTDLYDIQARGQGNPGKDDMRLMMRALLADRFHLALHYETREMPVLALVPAKPGSLGPQLKLHSEATPCSTNVASMNIAVPQTPEGLPALCNGFFGMPPSVDGRQKAAARNITMTSLANFIASVQASERPVIDGSGLAGTFDFSLEWTPDRPATPPGSDFVPDPNGPTLEAAMREQLGLKLESRRGPVEVIMLDNIEHLIGN